MEGQATPQSPPEKRVTKPRSGQDASSQSEAEDSKRSAKEPPSAAAEPSPVTCDEACQQGRENLAIQGKLEWFTGVLAIVGVLQVGTMIWQAWLLKGTLREIGKQADIAANSQRSWIVSTGIDRPDFSNPWIQHVPVHFKVIGNSPVRVTESNFRVRLVPAKVVDEKSDTRQPDLTEKPDYANPATLEDSPEMGTNRAPGTEFSVIPMLESLFLMEGSGETGAGMTLRLSGIERSF